MITKRAGFTLIELLVVIAVIALLMAILLPSLAKARASAVTVKCAANLHAIGQALYIYQSENSNCYPIGENDLNSDGKGSRDWRPAIADLMTSRDDSSMSTGSNLVYNQAANRKLNGVFTCPAQPPRPDSWGASGCGYTGHPWVFALVSTSGSHTKYYQYKSLWFDNPSNAAIVFDTAVVLSGSTQGYSYPNALNLDNNMATGSGWGTRLATESQYHDSGYDSKMNQPAFDVTLRFCDYDNPNPLAAAITASGNLYSVRFRHGSAPNGQANVLFADGHAETFGEVGKTITHGMLCVPCSNVPNATVLHN